MTRRAEGYITEVNPLKMLVKVRIPQAGDMETDWLQCGFTGPDEEFDYRKDDYVGLLMDDTLDDGWVICRLYPETASLSPEKTYKKKFRDGSEIKYEELTTTLTVKIGTNEFKASPGKIEISGAGSGGAVQSVVHDKSPCPVFGVCHILPSITIKVSP